MYTATLFNIYLRPDNVGYGFLPSLNITQMISDKVQTVSSHYMSRPDCAQQGHAAIGWSFREVPIGPHTRQVAN